MNEQKGRGKEKTVTRRENKQQETPQNELFFPCPYGDDICNKGNESGYGGDEEVDTALSPNLAQQLKPQG